MVSRLSHQQQAGVTCSTTSGASSESEDSSLLAQEKVINVQPGFLGWFLTKTHLECMQQIAILGLSVQGGNRYGSTLVLLNKNHVEVTIILYFIEQHGFYTIPTLNVQFQDGFYAIWMCFCKKNQPKKFRLDVYNVFISFVIVLASEAARVLCTFTQWLVPSYYPLCSGACSFLPYYFTAHFNLPNSYLAPSLFVAFASTRTPMLKPFAIENSVITATNGNEPNVENQKMRSGGQRAELCLSRAS